MKLSWSRIHSSNMLPSVTAIHSDILIQLVFDIQSSCLFRSKYRFLSWTLVQYNSLNQLFLMGTIHPTCLRWSTKALSSMNNSLRSSGTSRLLLDQFATWIPSVPIDSIKSLSLADAMFHSRLMALALKQISLHFLGTWSERLRSFVSFETIKGSDSFYYSGTFALEQFANTHWHRRLVDSFLPVETIVVITSFS